MVDADLDLEGGQTIGLQNTKTYLGAAEYDSSYESVVAASPVSLSFRYSFFNIEFGNPIPPDAHLELYYPENFINDSTGATDTFTECLGVCAVSFSDDVVTNVDYPDKKRASITGNW